MLIKLYDLSLSHKRRLGMQIIIWQFSTIKGVLTVPSTSPQFQSKINKKVLKPISRRKCVKDDTLWNWIEKCSKLLFKYVATHGVRNTRLLYKKYHDMRQKKLFSLRNLKDTLKKSKYLVWGIKSYSNLKKFPYIENRTDLVH